MPKGGLSHHIRLRDTSDTNDVGLVLHKQPDDTFAYSWNLAPALAPDVEQKDVNYGEFRSELQLTWSQSDWSGGALQFYYDPKNPKRYGIAKDTWPMTRNELSVGTSMREITFGVKNGGAETGSSSQAVGTGVIVSVQGSNLHTGHRVIRGADWSQNDVITFTIDMTDQPAARWQSQNVTARVRVSDTGVTPGNFRINIVESGGASTPTTNGANITTNTSNGSYKTATVNLATIQSDTTAISLQIERTDAGSDAAFLIDGVQFFPGGTSGDAATPNTFHLPMMEFGTDILLAFSRRAVWKFNGDEDYWMLQKAFAADITGAAIFNDQLYIGQGESTAYEYSDATDPTTYTTSNLASTAKNANRFIVTQNVNGNYVLAKTLNDDELFLATDPTNTGAWGSGLDVGKDDYDITNVHQIGDTVAVGKEDGFYQYLSLEGNRLTNIFPDAVRMPSVDNFSRGVNHMGQFYSIVGENGFIRWTGSRWEALGHLIFSPGFSEIGSRVRAFGTDGTRLYLLVEEPVAVSLTKSCWVLALREFLDGTWEVHTLIKLVCTDGTGDMIVSKATESLNTYLYISGSIGTGLSATDEEQFSWRMRLPNQTDNPRHTQSADHPLITGEFITSWMDWNRPNVLKAFNRFTLLTEDLSTSPNVRVSYEVDNDTSFTDINSSDSTFNTSPAETINFNSGVTGRRIRLRFIFANLVNTTAVIKGFFLEASWHPGRLKRWLVTCNLEDGQRGLLGGESLLPAQLILSRLKNLEAEVSPLAFSDIDGTDNNVHITNMGERMLAIATSEAGQGGARYKRVVDLELTEAF